MESLEGAGNACWVRGGDGHAGTLFKSQLGDSESDSGLLSKLALIHSIRDMYRRGNDGTQLLKEVGGGKKESCGGRTGGDGAGY